MIKYLVIIAAALAVVLLTLCIPRFLADNAFLDEFAGEGGVALLAVILTVTLASVVNIHLSLNKIIIGAYANNIKKGKEKAIPVRSEINQNAMLLIVTFILSLSFVFIKFVFTNNTYLDSFVNGFMIVFLIVNLAVLIDIYNVIFRLAEAEIDIIAARKTNE